MKPHGQCEGKRKYKTEDEAYHGLYNLRRSRLQDANDLNVYQCSTCGKYHVGHISKYLKRLKNEKAKKSAAPPDRNRR